MTTTTDSRVRHPVLVPHGQHEQLRLLSYLEDRSIASLVREALAQFLARRTMPGAVQPTEDAR